LTLPERNADAASDPTGGGAAESNRLGAQDSATAAVEPAGVRVVAGFGRHFLVRAEGERGRPLRLATRRGKRSDVVVGDLVRCSVSGEQATIESIAPRRSLLFRADAHRVKALAANIDRVAIVFAPRPPFDLHFLWRALLAARAAGIEALALLNKTDLTEGLGPAQQALEQAGRLGVATLAVSAKQAPQEARARLRAAIGSGATLLAGQSGMGKSTLLNLLVDAQARTQEYSTRLNVGRQTTTASRWFDLPDGGGALIDTPGFAAFGLAHLPLALRAAALPEFVPFLGHCRFRDCRHLSEPGCAVRAALERDEISAARYAFYADMAAEALPPPCR